MWALVENGNGFNLGCLKEYFPQAKPKATINHKNECGSVFYAYEMDD